MAGPFVGALLGTIGTRPGSSDMTPYLTMRRMQIQAEEQAAAQAQQQGQFDASMGQRQQEFASSQEQAKAEMEFKQREAERAKSRYELEFLNREEQQKQQSEMQKAEMDLRVKDQESLAKSREDESIQRRAEVASREQGAVRSAAAAEGEAFARQMFGRSDVGEDFASIDSSAAAWARHDYPDDPIAQKAYVTAASEAFAAMRKEREAKDRQKRADDLAMQREERIAQNEKADIEIKQRQIESYDNAKKMERAQKASAPFRKQQETIVRQVADLQTKLSIIEGQLEGAAPDRKPFYENARQGIIKAIDRLKASYDELEAKASAKEAEVLAGS